MPLQVQDTWNGPQESGPIHKDWEASTFIPKAILSLVGMKETQALLTIHGKEA